MQAQSRSRFGPCLPHSVKLNGRNSRREFTVDHVQERCIIPALRGPTCSLGASFRKTVYIPLDHGGHASEHEARHCLNTIMLCMPELQSYSRAPNWTEIRRVPTFAGLPPTHASILYHQTSLRKQHHMQVRASAQAPAKAEIYTVRVCHHGSHKCTLSHFLQLGCQIVHSCLLGQHQQMMDFDLI
jgi:hypothetical protein